MRIEAAYVSPGHNFFGRFGKAPGSNPMVEVESVECVAGRGIVGDRFFDHAAACKGQVTFFSLECYLEICREMRVGDKAPSVFRRNLIVSGADLNGLIGSRFRVQGIEFEGAEECRPCSWMDLAFAPGAEAMLKGRGGLRARVVTGGVLHVETGRTAAGTWV